MYSQSLVICEKLHLKIALIGPCPRQLTSDKTSFPGLVNKFQLKILLDHYSSHLHFFDSQTTLSDYDYDQHQKKKLLNLIDQKVSAIHAHKAEQYSNRKIGIVKSVAPRWSINFMADFSLRKRIRPPKGTDLVNTKVDNDLYLVYLHFWKNGYWFTSGLKYGVDWLAYEGSPEIFHSKYLVKYVDINESMTTSQMSHLCRLGSKTNKKLVLASISPTSTIITSQVSWLNRSMSHSL